jgi:hypothetical protein
MSMKRNRTRKPAKKPARTPTNQFPLSLLGGKGSPAVLPPELANRLAATTTGELFQPVRLHYAVSDPAQTERTLLKLKCMDRDPKRRRLVWLYIKEAAGLSFPHAPVSGPVVIGEFFRNGPGEIVLNVRSIERALAAVEFFDRYLPRTVAALTHVTVINRLFRFAETKEVTSLHALFENSPLTELHPEDLEAKLAGVKEQTQNAAARSAAMLRIFQELTQQPEPEMEKFPSHYYEDGIESLRLKLLTAQRVAQQHWQGNTGYTSFNAIADAIGNDFDPTLPPTPPPAPDDR